MSHRRFFLSLLFLWVVCLATTAAISNGEMFIRSNSFLYCIADRNQ